MAKKNANRKNNPSYSAESRRETFDDICKQWFSDSIVDSECEAAIISACLSDMSKNEWELINELESKMFYHDSYRLFFEVISSLQKDNVCIDIVSISEKIPIELKDTVVQLANRQIGRREQLELFIRIIQQSYIMRAYLSILTLAPSLFEDEPRIDDFFDEYKKRAASLYHTINIIQRKRMASSH